MPAVLRRLCSNSSSDGSRSPSDCETPPKRRRLTILAESKEPSKLFEEKVKANQVFELTPSTWTAEDFASRTPSRAEGISERDERIHRMRTCDQARAIVRGILGQGNAVSPAIEMCRLRAQALACYHVQLYYMSASLKQEASEVVALGASLAALKALNVLCFVDDLVRVYNEQQSALGKPEMELTLEVELRITSFNSSTALSSPFGESRPDLALDFVNETVDYLVGRLPESQAFSSCCQRRAPEKAAKLLAPQLREAARRFAVDAMLGPAAVLMRPVLVARVSVGMATRYILQQLSAEVSADEIMSFMTEVSSPPSACEKTDELRSATREVFGTYKLWGEEQCV